MLKNPLIKTLFTVTVFVFACLCFINSRGIIHNRQRQASAKVRMADFIKESDKKNNRSGEMGYADSQRMHDISRYTYKHKTITDSDLNWLMSLMEKTFPNGKPYSVIQYGFVVIHILPVETFTPQQKEAVFQKCSPLLSDQASGASPQNESVTQTCCLLLEKTKGQRAVPTLKLLLNSPNGRVQVAAARALTRLGHPVKVNIPNGGYGTLKNK